jgi:nuclear receptor interaction protein
MFSSDSEDEDESLNLNDNGEHDVDPHGYPVTPSPHPLRLADTILTGHRANIFSAKFLPHANTPTIVSCAGDSDIRVFDVDRLTTAQVGRRAGQLYGIDGPG